MKLLLISHGLFASGLLDSFEMIAGKNEMISTISLTNEGIGDFSNRLKNYLVENGDKKVLILCDLKGGTPYNEAYREYLKDPERIKVIAGMNLPMLVEAGLLISNDFNFEELYKIALEAGVTSIEGISEENIEEDTIEF